jgi:hypothetical protein
MLRQGDAKVFKKYSQMKLQMKREALEKINRQANEAKGFDTVNAVSEVLIRFEAENELRNGCPIEKWFKIKEASPVGA